MLGFGKPAPVAEHEAKGEIEQIYHEIRQTLRVSGVNLNFRTLAGYDKFFPLMWEAVKPNAETRAFEEAADHVRAEASRAAESLGRLEALTLVRPGESQAYQIRAALQLYQYINPKLLVLNSAVRLALDGERVGREGARRTERIARGVPAKMYPMDMVHDEPDDGRLQELFADIKQTLSLPSLNSDYLTLALWPDYLAAAWARLKLMIERNAYRDACVRLRDIAQAQARELPHPVVLTRQHIEESGDDVEQIVLTIDSFERLLPPLIMNIALMKSDWLSPETAGASPFPAEFRIED